MSKNEQPILAEIYSDLSAFSDPNTTPIVHEDGAVWEQNRETREIQFNLDPNQSLPRVTFRGKETSYREFLASDYMAGLHGLAEFMLRVIPENRPYIETHAFLVEDDGREQALKPAVDLLTRRTLSEELPLLSTKVAFVRGEAGAGKTALLRELARTQAIAYADGKAQTLFFYVDAQGRALSRLEEAISKELDDLRARFTYRELGPLVRHRLIVPIIDGFDELLGAGGYEDAFSSLAAFLSVLEGRGSLIASARSSFVDFQGIRRNAARFTSGGLNYELEIVGVKPWSDTQVDSYFEARLGPHSPLKVLEEIRQDSRNADLLRRPFYASRIADLLSEGGLLPSNEDLLGQLVEGFLSREKNKYLDRDRRPLLSLEGHSEFLTQLAEEIWWQENQGVDIETVRTIAELLGEHHRLQPSVARALVEKVSSYAFLCYDPGSRSYRFEHEVFYAYFLGQRLAELIPLGGGDLRRFLGRSVVDESLADRTVQRLLSYEGGLGVLIKNICASVRPSLAETVARNNGGELVSRLLLSRSTGDVESIFNLNFNRCGFDGLVLKNVLLEDCNFIEVSFDGATLSHCVLRKTILFDCHFSAARTDLTGTSLKPGLDVIGAVVHGEKQSVRLHSPAQIARSLIQIGALIDGYSAGDAPSYSDRVAARVQALERILQLFERRFYFSREEIVERLRSREQSEVLELLSEFGVIKERFISRSGPREGLLHLAAAPGVVRRGENSDDPAIPQNIKDFWVQVLAE